MSLRILPSGESAVLVECDGLDEVLALHDTLAAAPLDGLLELVPAARTLLVAVDPDRAPLETAAAWVRRAAPGARAPVPADPGRVSTAGAPSTGAMRPPLQVPGRSGVVDAGVGSPDRMTDAAHTATPADADANAAAAAATVAVPVVYDGADLEAAGALLDMTPEALVARHTAAAWRVAFIGFAPGFAYLVSDDWPFDVPRLDAPRTRVPAGAVGLAGGFSGVYPRESPGGWQLIGRTGLPLWDLAADPPALLTPGTRVRFERAGA